MMQQSKDCEQLYKEIEKYKLDFEKLKLKEKLGSDLGFASIEQKIEDIEKSVTEQVKIMEKQKQKEITYKNYEDSDEDADAAVNDKISVDKLTAKAFKESGLFNLKKDY